MSKKIRHQRYSKKHSRNTVYRLLSHVSPEVHDLFSRSKDKRDLKIIATNWRKESLGHVFRRDKHSINVRPASAEEIGLSWYWLEKDQWSKF